MQFAAHAAQACRLRFAALGARQRTAGLLGRFGIGPCPFRSGGSLGLGCGDLLTSLLGLRDVGGHGCAQLVFVRRALLGRGRVGRQAAPDFVGDASAAAAEVEDPVLAERAGGSGVHQDAFVAPYVGAATAPRQAPSE
ncbi:hypothetical protein ACWD6P_09235 [Streptomyces sp. NPDC002446]